MIGMISKKQAISGHDRVVILREDMTADIATVYEVDDARLVAASAGQDYIIPCADVKQTYIGPAGRIYVLGADVDYINDTVRLAALEKSTVLGQITQYAKPVIDPKKDLNLGKIMQWVLIGVLVLAVIFK